MGSLKTNEYKGLIDKFLQVTSYFSEDLKGLLLNYRALRRWRRYQREFKEDCAPYPTFDVRVVAPQQLEQKAQRASRAVGRALEEPGWLDPFDPLATCISLIAAAHLVTWTMPLRSAQRGTFSSTAREPYPYWSSDSEKFRSNLLSQLNGPPPLSFSGNPQLGVKIPRYVLPVVLALRDATEEFFHQELPLIVCHYYTARIRVHDGVYRGHFASDVEGMDARPDVSVLFPHEIDAETRRAIEQIKVELVLAYGVDERRTFVEII